MTTLPRVVVVGENAEIASSFSKSDPNDSESITKSDGVSPSLPSAACSDSSRGVSTSIDHAETTPKRAENPRQINGAVPIRVATRADIKDIDKANRAMLPENYSLEFYESFFAMKDCCNFVIDADDRNVVVSDGNKRETSPIAGYVLCCAEFDQKGQRIAHIYSIAVYERYRKRGFGTALLEAVESEMKRRHPLLAYIKLHVRKNTNSAALLFYCKNGYNNSKVVKGYYEGAAGGRRKKEDALLMKKPLRG